MTSSSHKAKPTWCMAFPYCLHPVRSVIHCKSIRPVCWRPRPLTSLTSAVLENSELLVERIRALTEVYITNCHSWKNYLMLESESVSHSFMSNSLQPHELWPARLFRPWNSPGKKTEVVAIPFSRGSSWPRDGTWVFCLAGRFFTIWAARYITIILEKIISC